MNSTTGQKKVGRPRNEIPRRERFHTYSASFPRELWAYVQRAVYRESSPGSMQTVQGYLNELIEQDRTAHEGTVAGKEKNS